MDRPNKKDYIGKSSQIDFMEDLNRYYCALEFYLDQLERERDFISSIRKSLKGMKYKEAKKLLIKYSKQQIQAEGLEEYCIMNEAIEEVENYLCCVE